MRQKALSGDMAKARLHKIKINKILNDKAEKYRMEPKHDYLQSKSISESF